MGFTPLKSPAILGVASIEFVYQSDVQNRSKREIPKTPISPKPKSKNNRGAQRQNADLWFQNVSPVKQKTAEREKVKCEIDFTK